MTGAIAPKWSARDDGSIEASAAKHGSAPARSCAIRPVCRSSCRGRLLGLQRAASGGELAEFRQPECCGARAGSRAGAVAGCELPSAGAGYYGPTTVELTTQSGAAVPVGALGPAPSPLRTPLAAPPDYPQGPYYAASVPKLAPATVYYVSWTEFVYTGMPPKCAGPYTRPLGSFKTR